MRKCNEREDVKNEIKTLFRPNNMILKDIYLHIIDVICSNKFFISFRNIYPITEI